MVEDFNIPTEVRICRTIREHDGLAMSSRNTYLTQTERPAASILFKALTNAKVLCEKKGKLSRNDIINTVNATLSSEPLVKVHQINNHYNNYVINNILHQI
jgi:pantoate--beta-alanine ligase